MRALLRSLAAVGLVAAMVVAAGVTSAPAQPKDATGTIEVYQGKDGWRYRVKDAEGKTLAVGVAGYETKQECLKVVDALKATMPKAKVVDLTKDDKKDDKKKDDKKGKDEKK